MAPPFANKYIALKKRSCQGYVNSGDEATGEAGCPEDIAHFHADHGRDKKASANAELGFLDMVFRCDTRPFRSPVDPVLAYNQ
jgi:hypothetical protein